MSVTMPEKPLLVYPSLARKLGVEAALLFGLCEDMLACPAAAIVAGKQGQGIREVTLSHTQWLKMTEFWDVDRVNELVAVIVRNTAISIAIASDGRVRIADAINNAVETPAGTTHDESGVSARFESAESKAARMEAVASVRQLDSVERLKDTKITAAVPSVAELPVYDQPPPMPRRPLPSRTNANIRERGPAPVFGGSIGWKRQKDDSQQDRLQQLFEQHEERNQKLHPMYLGWTPSELFYSMLPRHQIPREVVDTCIDEFILYYIDKERKESNWDQKFLAWVKREWVQKQTRESREQRKEQSFSGQSNENTRRDSKENRKRVTAAIMDIKDTDW
ncbi:DnaT-like ssDNA-binding domain-containing protein [Neptunomonas phycophila]|jgi:hypothetical protein|uniref:DnaT-like ssDNA-binding domain-containing protein n=1 Tax=Neptunomonas phycophila TaxID=1572645 RepID=UPI003737055F